MKFTKKIIGVVNMSAGVGHSGGFALLVVLFILLIIIGASYAGGGYGAGYGAGVGGYGAY